MIHMILKLGRLRIQNEKIRWQDGEEGWLALCTSTMPCSHHLLLTFIPGASVGRMLQPQLLGQQGPDQECSHRRGGQPELALGDTGLSKLSSPSPLPQFAGLCLALSFKVPRSSLPTRFLSGKGSRVIRATG